MRSSFLFSVVLCLAAVLPGPVRAAEIAVVVSSRSGAFGQALKATLAELGTSAQVIDLSTGQRPALQQQLADSDARVQLTIGPIAARFAAKAAPDRPTVTCLTRSPGKRNGASHVGVPLAVPSSEVFASLRAAMPSVRNISALYDPDESEAVARRAVAQARQAGVELKLHPLGGNRPTSRVLAEALSRTDAVWLLPDRAMANRETLRFLLVQSFEKRVPLITSFEAVARQGAMLAVLPDPSAHGRAAAQLARGLAAGQSASSLALPELGSRSLVNLRTASRIGIRIPDAYLAQAYAVIR